MTSSGQTPPPPPGGTEPEIYDVIARLDQIAVLLQQQLQLLQQPPAPQITPVYLGGGLVHLPTKLGYSVIGFGDDLQITAELIRNRIWEPALAQFLTQHIKPGMQVVEIGANIGFFSVLLSFLVGFKGRVDVFEPNPRTLEVLGRNIRMNNVAHVCHVHPLALSDREGTVTLNVFTRNQGGSTLSTLPSSLTDTWLEEPRQVEVPTRPLDTFFAGDPRKIDFLKIDAEGAEMLIWRGGRRFFQENTHAGTVISMEFNPPGLEGLGCNPPDLLALVRSHGFRIWHLRAENEIVEIVSDTDLPPSANTDLLLCRGSL